MSEENKEQVVEPVAETPVVEAPAEEPVVAAAEEPVAEEPAAETTEAAPAKKESLLKKWLAKLKKIFN